MDSKDAKNIIKDLLEKPFVCTENRIETEKYFITKKVQSKPKTNADRIRNFSDEELTDMLHNIGSYIEDGEPLIDIFVGEEKTIISDDFGSIKEWLQAEVKEGAE